MQMWCQCTLLWHEHKHRLGWIADWSIHSSHTHNITAKEPLILTGKKHKESSQEQY